jgi:hypothetical protein
MMDGNFSFRNPVARSPSAMVGIIPLLDAIRKPNSPEDLYKGSLQELRRVYRTHSNLETLDRYMQWDRTNEFEMSTPPVWMR